MKISLGILKINIFLSKNKNLFLQVEVQMNEKGKAL